MHTSCAFCISLQQHLFNVEQEAHRICRHCMLHYWGIKPLCAAVHKNKYVQLMKRHIELPLSITTFCASCCYCIEHSSGNEMSKTEFCNGIKIRDTQSDKYEFLDCSYSLSIMSLYHQKIGFVTLMFITYVCLCLCSQTYLWIYFITEAATKTIIAQFMYISIFQVTYTDYSCATWAYHWIQIFMTEDLTPFYITWV